MIPLEQMSQSIRSNIRYVLTDIDDTLTDNGRLRAAAYTALERLKESGLTVIPITGRPAGWCDHIARMWPVDAVIGENGAFYYRYDHATHRMQRRYAKTDAQRSADTRKLEELAEHVLTAVPGTALSADQSFRIADLAVDFREDVPQLPAHEIQRIRDICIAAGAQAKISSIHVNTWFGEYNKLTMTRQLFTDLLDLNLDDIREQVIFAGDSPNDAPMFGYFPNAVGVANVQDFVDTIEALPKWITSKRGGEGFSEIAQCLLGS